MSDNSFNIIFLCEQCRLSCQDVTMYARSLFPLIFVLAQGHGATKPTDQKNSFIDLRTNRPVNIEESCKTVPCLVKCCPMDQILFRNVSEGSDMESSICISNPDVYGIESPFDYSNSLDIYNKDIKETIVKTKKKLTDFTFLSHEKFLNLSCCVNFLQIFDPNNTYVTEDGRLLRQKFNYYDNWSPDYDTENFCFEHEIYVDEMGTISTSPSIALYGIATPVSDLINNRAVVSAYSMLVSCWFLLLVLVVYGLLKELRNLAGMMLMAYVATLTVAFLTRAAQVFANDVGAMDSNQCVGVGLFFLYSLMASFTWLNVMSFDIWWSMRGFRKCRKIHRQGIPIKFAWYCLYAWGVPLMLILFVVIVEHTDLRHLPNFVKPHIVVNPDECFLPEDERQLYLNAPIAVATSINLVLFLMTAYNIWRIKSGVARSADSNRNKTDESRFGIYLKLSSVMGIGWILEVVSALWNSDSRVWYITDFYNTLIGLFIFIIFVCKRNVLNLLCKRFHIENEFVKRWDHGSNYTQTTSTRGKRNALDSLTENSDMGEASATDYINRVKCNSTKPQYPILNDSNHQGCPTYQLLGKNTSF
ncbi:G-protein coupled receptor Mth2-like isoform X2 [Choristoneura fumiferana]|uniref:G-protein coupled receptor Mth2-like isoform X2 n=1 Tax=Choristoneura fumiferana TaxID=7141 RepID=UPI003D158176